MKEYWNSLSTMKKIRLIGAILLGLFVIVFAIRNWRDTEVVFLFSQTKMPLTIIMVLSGAAGFALASLFDYKKFKKRDKEIKRLTDKVNELSNR